MASLFSPSLRPRVRALAVSFVPETSSATEGQWTAFEAAIDRAVSARPPALARQLGLLIRILDGLARLRYGRALARLSPQDRTVLLERLATSRVLLIRRGIWGLRTLVLLGWYSQPEVVAALGYRASPAGWSARQ